MLSGKKTYIVGIAAILSGIAGMVIAGSLTQGGIQTVLPGIGMLPGRVGPVHVRPQQATDVTFMSLQT